MVVHGAGRIDQGPGGDGFQHERRAQRDVQVAGVGRSRSEETGGAVRAAGHHDRARRQPRRHGRGGRDRADGGAGQNDAGEAVSRKSQVALDGLRPGERAGIGAALQGRRNVRHVVSPAEHADDPVRLVNDAAAAAEQVRLRRGQVQDLGQREGRGDFNAEGSQRAAETLGRPRGLGGRPQVVVHDGPRQGTVPRVSQQEGAGGGIDRNADDLARGRHHGGHLAQGRLGGRGPGLGILLHADPVTAFALGGKRGPPSGGDPPRQVQGQARTPPVPTSRPTAKRFSFSITLIHESNQVGRHLSFAGAAAEN